MTIKQARNLYSDTLYYYLCQVNKLAARNEGKGLEIGVRAQEVLHKMQQKGEADLAEQCMDYQQKLDKMVRQMEKQACVQYGDKET